MTVCIITFLILCPVWLNALPGEYCDGRELELSGGEYGVNTLKEVSLQLYRNWLAYIIIHVAIPILVLCCYCCIAGFIVKKSIRESESVHLI